MLRGTICGAQGIFRGKPIMWHQRKPDQVLELHDAHQLQLRPPRDQLINPLVHLRHGAAAAGAAADLEAGWAAGRSGTGAAMAGGVPLPPMGAGQAGMNGERGGCCGDWLVIAVRRHDLCPNACLVKSGDDVCMLSDRLVALGAFGGGLLTVVSSPAVAPPAAPGLTRASLVHSDTSSIWNVRDSSVGSVDSSPSSAQQQQQQLQDLPPASRATSHFDGSPGPGSMADADPQHAHMHQARSGLSGLVRGVVGGLWPSGGAPGAAGGGGGPGSSGGPGSYREHTAPPSVVEGPATLTAIQVGCGTRGEGPEAQPPPCCVVLQNSGPCVVHNDMCKAAMPAWIHHSHARWSRLPCLLGLFM